MGLKRTDKFRADAVRIALTSGMTSKQVASDLGWPFDAEQMGDRACIHAILHKIRNPSLPHSTRFVG